MDLKQKLFEIRSYTPIPFILIAIIFAEPTFETLSIGFAIAIIGESIRFWGVSICGSVTRTTGAVGATNLVTDGPFGFVRNPLYVGNILMYVGCSFTSNSIYPWLQITTPIYFIFQYHIIVLKEEEYLRKVFKEEYSNYEKNVPRFFPRLTKYIGNHSFHRKADLSRGLKSESRTLQSFILISAIMLYQYFKNL